MSEEHVKVMREIVENFNQGGVEAALPHFDSRVEWVGPREWLDDHLYRGHEGLRKLASQWTDNFDEYRLDPDRFIDAGNSVVVLLFARGRIKGSELPISQENSWVCRVEGNKARHVQVYFSWHEGLEHAGLAK
jgi:ketosteroid isomerase-like protein